MTSSNEYKYGRSLIALHWLMFFLLIFVYAVIEFRVLFDKGMPEREFMKSLHFMFGLLVLLLVLFRLVARRLNPRPPPHSSEGWYKLLHIASQVGHWALYALMLGMPLMGWMALSAAGKPIPFFGLVMPALIGPDETLSKQLKSLHETAGSFGYILIGVHVLAAFFHQFVLKDSLMTRLRWR
ncbi:CybB Cytochrome B561 [Burkholderiaceae bacterium]|jgi:cytochrome b561